MSARAFLCVLRVVCCGCKEREEKRGGERVVGFGGLKFNPKRSSLFDGLAANCFPFPQKNNSSLLKSNEILDMPESDF